MQENETDRLTSIEEMNLRHLKMLSELREKALQVLDQRDRKRQRKAQKSKVVQRGYDKRKTV